MFELCKCWKGAEKCGAGFFSFIFWTSEGTKASTMASCATGSNISQRDKKDNWILWRYDFEGEKFSPVPWLFREILKCQESWVHDFPTFSKFLWPRITLI